MLSAGTNLQPHTDVLSVAEGLSIYFHLQNLVLLVGTGSLTVLKRTSSPRRQSSTRSSSQASLQSDSYASIDLGTEHLPPIDTPEASHVCSLR